MRPAPCGTLSLHRLLAAWVLALAGVLAADLDLPPGTYRPVGQARYDHYNLTLVLAPPAGLTAATAIDVVFACNGPRDYARLRWDATGFVLERQTGGGLVVMGRGGEPLPPELARGGTVEIRTRPSLVEVIALNRRVYRGLHAGTGRGPVATATGAGVAEVADCACQRVEPITFGDDFMRTEKEAVDWGLWQPAAGHWRLYSVMERIQANPDARIRDGRGPEAGRSPNPFCLSGEGVDGAFILTGNTFWTDYEAAVSVRSFESVVGLVFAARDAADCWMVRWGLTSLGLRPARLELVQRRDGQERVAAATTVSGRAEAWYRLGVRLVGDHITVLVDEVPVLEHRDAGCTGGRIGLYSCGRNETFFDDVSVRSVSALALDDPAELSSDAVRPLSGVWQVAAGERGCTFTGHGESRRGAGALALCAVGWREWPAQCLESTVEAGPQATFGVAFGVTGDGQYVRVLVSRDGRDGHITAAKVSGGTVTDLVRVPCPLPAAGPIRLCVDARDGVLKVRTAGVTRLRLRPDADLGGALGLLVLGRVPVAFTAVTLFAEPHEDWEQPVNIERFAADPFMQGWASTRYVWVRLPGADRATFPQHFVHNGDFYGPFRVSAPVQDRLAFFFGLDEVIPEAGYCVETRVDAEHREGTLTLSRGNRTLARARFTPGERQVLPGQQIVDEKIGALPRTPDTESYGTLELNRDGHMIWASIAGTELFCVHDPEPLTGRAIGLQVAAPMDFIHISAVRGNIQDELFEKAAVGWLPVGRWEVTNRFACDPRWSNMNGSSKGVAALWSKLAFAGDCTIEFYAGMRMRQEDMMEGADRMYYPRVGDINLSLATRAGELFSGYSLLVTAWDPMWTESMTQLRRLGEVVAQTDRELVPRGRLRSPKARAVQVDWDPGGRPVHGAWYFVKVRRTGSRYDVWFDNAPVFSFTDPEPLAAQRLALWTQHNSIVIARAKISYRECVRVVEAGPPVQERAAVAPAVPAASAPRLCSPTHPQRSFDMEGSLPDFTPWNGDQSVEMSLEARAGGGTALRCENLYGGGDVGVRLPLCGVDLGRDSVLEMDVAAEPGTLVSLYLAFADRPAEVCFVPLSGPRDEGPNMVRLGDAEGMPADGKWRHVRWNLGAWARQRFPWRPSFRVQYLMIGMLHEGYLNAGLGGNAAGAVYRLDNVSFASAGGMEVGVECHVDALDGWRWRAWLARTADSPGPAGVPDLRAPCLVLRADGPGDWFVHGEYADRDTVRRLPPLPVRVSAPLAVASTDPAPGAAWGGGHVRIVFAESAGHPDLPHCQLTLGGSPLPVNETTASYDPARRELDVRVVYGGEPRPAKTPLELVLQVPDSGCGSAAVGPNGRVGEPPADLVYRWEAIFDDSLDRTPPCVELTGDLVRVADFNQGLATTTLLAPPDECRMGLVPGLDGTPALQLENNVCGSTFNVDLSLPAFAFGRCPRLAFDYRVDAYAQCDFMFRFLGQQWTLGFTDGDPTGGLLMGSVDGVVRDGAWHHAEVELPSLRPRAFRRMLGQAGNITEVGFGDWVYPSNAPGARVAVDNVTLIPVVSTAAGSVGLAWTAHDPSGIKGYSYLWDQTPSTEPDTSAETSESKGTFAALPAGEAYFHIRACDGAGNWGPASHGRFLVDNEPPLPVATVPAAAAKAAAESFRVRFGPSLAGLDPSGLTLAINGKTYPARAGGTWDAATGEFVFDLLADRTLLSGVVADGSQMSVTLAEMRDYAGNRMAPFTWSWNVDYALDKTGPQPPRLWGYGNAFENYDHFSGGNGSAWRPYGDAEGVETEVNSVTLPGVGPCLEVRKVGTGMRFAAYRGVGQYSLKDSPLLSFDYCLTAGAKVNLLLLINRDWYQVTMTGSDHLPALGRIAAAQADGQWRHAVVDLAESLRQGLPDAANPQIRLLAFGEWGTDNPAGTVFYLDNIALLGPSCPLPLARYWAADATGIRSYRLSFTQEPREEFAGGGSAAGDSPVLLAAADAPGTWYIHAQAQDGAANWGETLNFPYLCTQPVAQYTENGFEAGGTWRVSAALRASQGTLYRAKGRGVNELIGVQLEMRASCDVEISRGVAIDVPATTVIEADLYLQGDKAFPVAACVRPAGSKGAAMVGDRVDLAPGVWQRGVKLALPKEALERAAGGPDKPLRLSNLGLMVTPGRGAHAVLLIDHVKVNGNLTAPETADGRSAQAGSL
jgi:hypothetical protein